MIWDCAGHNHYSGHKRHGLLAGAVADEGLLPGLAALGAAGGAQGFRGGPAAAIPGRWDRWQLEPLLELAACGPDV